MTASPNKMIYEELTSAWYLAEKWIRRMALFSNLSAQRAICSQRIMQKKKRVNKSEAKARWIEFSNQAHARRVKQADLREVGVAIVSCILYRHCFINKGALGSIAQGVKKKVLKIYVEVRAQARNMSAYSQRTKLRIPSFTWHPPNNVQMP